LTPLLYRFKIRDSQVRISGSNPSIPDLTDYIRYYNEKISSNKDGSYSEGNSTLDVDCRESFYQNIFQAKSPLISYYITPMGIETEILRARHLADLISIHRPESGKTTLHIEARDVVKELRLTPILESESYDDRGWKHGDLMKELADKAGIEIICSDYSFDPLLPVSENTKNPALQFQKGANIWEAMLKVRSYSGWLLYPNNEGKLVYRPRPTNSDSADWTIDASTAKILNVEYQITDIWRTRFLIGGKAGKDNLIGDYKYQAGDNLVGGGYHKVLENEIGRSRPIVELDMINADWQTIEKVIKNYFDIYTGKNIFFSFEIQDFENYFNMFLYQVINYTDSDISYINGKYLITSLSIIMDKFSCKADVEAQSLF